MKTDSERKRFRERANRKRRALLNEKKKYGSYDDSGGKRYRIGVDYLAAGEIEKAIEYFRWFEGEFSDDVGEPIFLLFWALAEYRAGNPVEATRRLKIAMISNPYMLPRVVGESRSKYDIWHFSNWQRPEYLDRIGEYLGEPSEEEREWIREHHCSPSFQALLAEFLSVYKALQHERDPSRRRALLDRWHEFEAKSVAHGA